MVDWSEVNRVLEATGYSLAKTCSLMDAATSRNGLRDAFCHFNSIIHMFTDSVPSGTESSLVLETVASFESSERFRTLHTTRSSVGKAVTAYKRLVLKDHAGSSNRRSSRPVRRSSSMMTYSIKFYLTIRRLIPELRLPGW